MAELLKDPVCDMEIDRKESAGKSEYQGTTYYFCSETCKRDFDADQQKYLGGGGPAGVAVEAQPTKRWWEFWK